MRAYRINRASIRAGAALGSLAFALALPSVTWAQDAEGNNKDDKEIIVTGTFIRGSAPVGSNAISLGEQKLEEIAAQSSNELLASIPQVTNYFNRVPVADLAIAVNQMQVSRPNIRNLSGNNAASSATLILVDGHRVATAGTSQASVDPDLIPTGAVARVEVMTEGGSATYGADAVAGVINFITHRRYDGVKVEGHYGFADDYYQWDASVTAGKTWDNGSAWVSYSYTKNDDLFGRDRDWIRVRNYAAAGYPGTDQACANPNLAVNTILTAFGATISSASYAAPTFAANTTNFCDNGENSAVIPKAERHGAMGGLTWDFGEATSIDVRAYWSQRKTVSTQVNTASTPINANNPNAASSMPSGVTLGIQPYTIFGSPVLVQAGVNLSFEPLADRAYSQQTVNIRQWGANAELKHKLGDNWQVRGLLNWSESDSVFHLPRVSTSRLSAISAPSTLSTAAASFNPFNLAANSATLLNDIFDNELAAQAKDHLINGRLIADGKLFELPGGDVRVAFGYEYMHDKLEKRTGTDVRLGTLGNIAADVYSRDVHSLFGELVLPLLANGDGGSLLTVSAQGRYDHYSDFGDTFNPKIGATLKPASWLTIRGNWGTSFTAPTPLDQLGSLSGSISPFPFVPFTPVGGPQPLSGTNYTIAFQGSRPGLQPQEADTWSFGVDLTPMDGLRVSANYYNVKFSNILGTPTPGNGIFTEFPDNVLYNVNGVSGSAVTSFLTSNGSAPLSTALASQLSSTLTGLAGARIVEVVDFRVGNFGILKVEGIDFSMNYRHTTDWGGIDVGMNFNAPLKRERQASPTAAIADELQRENSKLQLQSMLGFDIGAFRAQATWSHSAGYAITPTTSNPIQSKVGAFNTVDLFFKYDVPGDGMFKDLSFTLNVKNVGDTAPPVLLRTQPNERGFANGFSIGRMFILGASKKF